MPANPKVQTKKAAKISKSKIKHKVPKISLDASVLPVGFAQQTKYTNQDKKEFGRIKHDLELEMVGQKRGRKEKAFADYCERTSERITQLKKDLAVPNTSETQKNKIRNRISAYQARLKNKIATMDQVVKIE